VRGRPARVTVGGALWVRGRDARMPVGCAQFQQSTVLHFTVE